MCWYEPGRNLRQLCVGSIALALDFTSERLITLLRRAGKALEVLDLGDGAGNHMSQNRRYDLTADDPETVPLGAIMASMTEASGWSRLHTLRIRHEMPWLKKKKVLKLSKKMQKNLNIFRLLT